MMTMTGKGVSGGRMVVMALSSSSNIWMLPTSYLTYPVAVASSDGVDHWTWSSGSSSDGVDHWTWSSGRSSDGVHPEQWQ